jgi:RNA polymerase sigma factor (sigma-70 family)
MSTPDRDDNHHHPVAGKVFEGIRGEGQAMARQQLAVFPEPGGPWQMYGKCGFELVSFDWFFRRNAPLGVTMLAEEASMAAPSLNTILRELKRRSDGPAGCNDAELLGRFLSERDESAFELLVWRHGGMVFRVCRNLLGREADAEDAFQATFLILARDARRIGRRSSLAGWLYRVARRVALRLRHNRKQAGPLTIEPAANGPEPADALVERERCDALLDEIDRLPDRYRSAVVLCGLEGKTSSQAAGELGCPTGTIDSRLAWARERLRKRLARRGIAPVVAIPAAVVLAAAPSRLVAALPRHAAAMVRGGPAALAGTVSPNALTLLHGMSSMMIAKKLTLVSACLVLMALIGIGTNGRTDRPAAAQEPQDFTRKSELAADDGWHLKRTIKVADAPILSLMFTPSGKHVLATAGGKDAWFGKTAIWDVASGAQTIRWSGGSDSRVWTFSPDGRFLLATERAGKAVMREVGTGKEVWELELKTPRGEYSLALSPDGKTLAVGERVGETFFFRLAASDKPVAAGEFLLRLTEPAAPVRSVAFSPDGTHLYTSQGDKIVIWDAATGKALRTIESGAAQTQPLVSPDGKSVFAWWDSRVAKLDLTTGKLLFTFRAANQTIAATALSPDGRLVAVAAHGEKDGSDVLILDAQTGKQIARLTGHAQPVRTLAFSPDGKLLASGEDGGVIKIWERGGSGAGATAATNDRLDRLIDDLLRAKKSDEQCVEGLFLAALGRLPQETEARFVVQQLGKLKDRREGLRDVLFMLVNTKEFGQHVQALQTRRN